MVERASNLSDVIAVRRLFPRRRIGLGIYRIALQNRTPEEIINLRREFGEGLAGTQAFVLITMGAVCEMKDNQNGQCDKKASLTVDFDVFGTLEQIPVCNENHAESVRNTVANDLGKSNLDATFGINGRGRS